MNTSIPVPTAQVRHATTALAAAMLLALAVTSGRAAAGETPKASKRESVGVASGFVVGAAAGGPVGALVGAATGGWLGDRMHRERRDGEAARDALTTANQRADGLTMHLMFRTEASQLRPEDEPLVLRFAALAKATPDAKVRVTGFADPRGTPRYNAALAAERAAQVAARLTAAGVPAEKLVVSSETQADVAAPSEAIGTPLTAIDLDGYAFARRVTLQLVVAPQGELALAHRR